MLPTLPTLGRNKTPEVYERAQILDEGSIIGFAQSLRVVIHVEFGDIIARGIAHTIHGPTFGTFLGDLVERTFDRYDVKPSSVVVRSDGFATGGGFQHLADALGLRQRGEDGAAWLTGCGRAFGNV